MDIEMTNDDKLDPPKSTTGDTAHLVGSALLSFFPGAPELFSKFVTPPLETRRIAWMQEVAAALRKLESSRGISIEQLSKDDDFVSVVLQATSVALRNHHVEKRRALANCIVNAGTYAGNPDADLQLAFVRFVDELSLSHIRTLHILASRQHEIGTLGSYELVYQTIHREISESLSRDAFKMIFLELQARCLIRISEDLEDFAGLFKNTHLIANVRNEGPRVSISEIGNKFLDFISAAS